MADLKKIVEDCVPGDFFVDRTCINCDTCRQLAPSVFADQGSYSYVKKQPSSQTEIQEANRALLSCPTASIGTCQSHDSSSYVKDFPLQLDENIFYCGFNSRKSYGANSYFIQHEQGNWLVDSPRFIQHLVTAFERMGGIKYIFLTHQDDVADAKDYAKQFGATRIIHEADMEAAPDAELIIKGDQEFSPVTDFKIIPVPGHTKGHMVLIVRNQYLFSGDHLAYDPETDRLIAFHDACWYSWAEQRRSMKRLANHDFNWILTGHGSRVHLDPQTMKAKLADLIERMK